MRMSSEHPAAPAAVGQRGSRSVTAWLQRILSIDRAAPWYHNPTESKETQTSATTIPNYAVTRRKPGHRIRSDAPHGHHRRRCTIGRSVVVTRHTSPVRGRVLFCAAGGNLITVLIAGGLSEQFPAANVTDTENGQPCGVQADLWERRIFACADALCGHSPEMDRFGRCQCEAWHRQVQSHLGQSAELCGIEGRVLFCIAHELKPRVAIDVCSGDGAGSSNVLAKGLQGLSDQPCLIVGLEADWEKSKPQRMSTGPLSSTSTQSCPNCLIAMPCSSGVMGLVICSVSSSRRTLGRNFQVNESQSFATSCGTMAAL